MDAGAMRCPFCVADNDFRRMIPMGDDRYACANCRHVIAPKEKGFQCQCERCIRLRARVAAVSPLPHFRKQEHKNTAAVSKQPVASDIPDGFAGVPKPA